MAIDCKPENKYPPKPCPCPEIPGPPGPQGPIGLIGPQGPPGDPCENCDPFSARINPTLFTGTIGDDFFTNVPSFTAVPIGGTGPFTYSWNTNTVTPPQASSYITQLGPSISGSSRTAQELAVSPVAVGSPVAVVAIAGAPLHANDGEGVIVCEVTDTITGGVALAYHFVKIIITIP